jgi:tripartite-type tricarboxylate transporter receptor subunit TctC
MHVSNTFCRHAAGIMLGLSVFMLVDAPSSADELDVLKGQTIRVIIGGSPGATTDVAARALFDTMEGILPDTTIRIQNINGSGGGKAINEMMGSEGGSLITLVVAGNGPIYAQLTSPDLAKHDLTSFQWIGAIEKAERFLGIRGSLKSSSVDALRSLERQPISPTSDKLSSSTIQNYLVSAMLGLRLKVVTGTDDGQQSAMILSGDVDALIGNPFDMASMVESGDIIPVLKFSKDTVAKILEDVPAIADIVPADLPKELPYVLETLDQLGRVYAAAPATDPQVVGGLRVAFDRAASDPAFVEEMSRQKINISPTSGTQVSEAIEKLLGPSGASLRTTLQSYLACGEKMSDQGVENCN